MVRKHLKITLECSIEILLKIHHTSEGELNALPGTLPVLQAADILAFLLDRAV
jgi:hypothetical protein